MENWIDSHSVNCIKCSHLVDERKCVSGPNGVGDICPDCQESGGYVDSFDGDLQVTLEEMIASRIFDAGDVETDEETAAQLGRDILYMVLSQMRPDLITNSENGGGW